MKDLAHKVEQFFSREDFTEYGDDARLELTPAELRQISNLIKENIRLKTELDFIEKEATSYYPKFKNRQEKQNVFRTITTIQKCLNIIGNDDAIDDISVLKEMVRKMEVMEEQDESM